MAKIISARETDPEHKTPSGYTVEVGVDIGDGKVDRYYRDGRSAQVIDDHASKCIEVWQGGHVKQMPKNAETGSWLRRLLGLE